MPKILLVKPHQPTGCTAMSPPLGILYLASNLRRALGDRISVDALDARLYSLRSDEVVNAARDADIIGLSAENSEAGATKEIARLIKRVDPNKRVVVGGPYAHNRCVEVLDACPDIDWAFDGESDRVFPEAVRRHLDGEDFDGILGMYFRRDGRIVRPEGTDTIKDLDALPFPAWDLCDFDAYEQGESMSPWRMRRRYGSLFTSRGCPYKCAYCHDIFGKKFRFRSAENVLEEIHLLVEKYGVEEFQIVDDIFNLHKPRLKKIFAGLEERYGVGRLHFDFPNGLRGDILTDDVVKTLKRGGAYAVSLAIETVTPRLQTLIQKDLDIPKVKRFIDVCHDEGILTRGFFMLGFPTETKQELLDTIRFALKSQLTFATFFGVIPQPETPLYALAKQQDAAALTQVTENDYYTNRTWYELATGISTRRLSSLAYIAFYPLSPTRIWRMLTRIPLWNLGQMTRQFVGIVVLRRSLLSPGRRRLRKFRPELELPEPTARSARGSETYRLGRRLRPAASA